MKERVALNEGRKEALWVFIAAGKLFCLFALGLGSRQR